MSKKLEDSVILRILREEWNVRKANLFEETKARFATASPGLKLRHKDSGTLFTVTAVGTGQVRIKDPTGQEVTVSSEDLEKGFEVF